MYRIHIKRVLDDGSSRSASLDFMELKELASFIDFLDSCIPYDSFVVEKSFTVEKVR